MLNEWELWACANELIRQHGEDAVIHAAMRADALMEAGDLEGARSFTLIVRRINELMAKPTGQLH